MRAPDTAAVQVAEWMTAHRKIAGLSQAAVARRIGITPAALCRWEHADRTPTIDHLLAWAAAVDTTLHACIRHIERTTT